MKIRPAENHLLVKESDVKNVTECGIIVEYEENGFPVGEIRALGPFVSEYISEDPLSLKLGDKVMFNGLVGVFMVGSEPMTLIERDHVIAVVEDEKEER